MRTFQFIGFMLISAFAGHSVHRGKYGFATFHCLMAIAILEAST